MDFRLCRSSEGGKKEADSKYILKVEPKVFAIRLLMNVETGEEIRWKGRGGKDEDLNIDVF